MDNNLQKTCTKCKIEKNISEFSLQRKQFDKNVPPNIVNDLSNLIPLWKEDHKKIHNND